MCPVSVNQLNDCRAQLNFVFFIKKQFNIPKLSDIQHSDCTAEFNFVVLKRENVLIFPFSFRVSMFQRD